MSCVCVCGWVGVSVGECVSMCVSVYVPYMYSSMHRKVNKVFTILMLVDLRHV